MPLVSRKRHGVLVLLALLAIVTYLDRIAISVAGPRMQVELGIDPAAWGWVVGAFALAYAAFEIPAGHLGDRLGPRLVIARIVVWWSAFTALTGAVSNFYALVVTRFCFGAGEAGAYPNISASIRRWFPASERGRAFGVVWMASQAGGALAPLLVIALQVRFGWRAAFFAFAGAGVAWSLIWSASYRDNPRDKSGITEQELKEIGGGVEAAPPGLPWRAMVRSRNLRLVMLVALTYCYAMYFFISWLPTYLAKARGFSERELSLSALPFLLGAAANFLGGYAGDAFVRRWGLARGRRLAGVMGLGAAAVSMAAAIVMPHGYAALGLLGLSYACITFQQPSIWAVCLDIGGRHAGAVSAAMNSAAQVGSFLLSISFGYLVKFTGSYHVALLPVALVPAAGALLWLGIDASKQLASQPEARGPYGPID
ncbi:MAG: MFS transporter [Bryobacteraceae bacterium]|nr:MFS transporter [Bryobacteraceae bacterium]